MASQVLMRASIVCVVIAAFTLVAPAFAAQGGFTSTLSSEQLQSTGVGSLSADEQAALNAQVAAEVALARQGDVKGFAGTFTSRRSPEERRAAGLDRLTEEEQVELDRIVASVIASGPIQPRFSRILTNEDVSRAHKRFETHGSISYTMGWGSGGRSFQGGSVSALLFDTETGSSIEFTYSQYDGDLLGFYGAGYLDRQGIGCIRDPLITGRGPGFRRR